jgi:hypothetical protein
MKVILPIATRLVALGSARTTTKANGGVKLIEPNMVLRYD